MADITFKEYLEGRSRQERMKGRQKLLDDFKEFKRRQKVREQKTMAKAGKMIKKMLTGGQSKIAAKAPPTNKIDEKDFAVLRAEKAKGRGQGLQDEKMKPGKVMKADKGGMGEAKEYKKYLRGLKRASGIMSPADFFKKRREIILKGPARKLGSQAAKAAKATRIGKIAAGVAGAALLGKAALEKMYEKRTGKKPFTKRPEKKMGGGMMMQKPMGNYMGGGLSEATQRLKAQGKMGGGMMMRPNPIGMRSGKSVKVKCKIGRNKPTKMY